MHLQKTDKVVGRYAPSPTGNLHLGNLRTALAAWLHARLHNGVFLIRIEDLDTPRVVAGSDVRILKDLEQLGIDWDGEVSYQSHNTQRYEDVLNRLSSLDLSYPCFCSRKDILTASSAPHLRPNVYPGTCSNLSSSQIQKRKRHKSPAFRVRVNAALSEECGDFVIHRADGLYAYQLAVVIDDFDQNISHVVRGADLKESTPKQSYLSSIIFPNAPIMEYLHVPLMIDSAGRKLSKRDGSDSLSSWLEQGKTVNQLIGEFAKQLNLQNDSQPVSAEELLNEQSVGSFSRALES